MWRQLFLSLAVAVVVLWLLLVAALWLLRPRGRDLTQAIRLLPDLIRLLTRLARDTTLPRRPRIWLWLLLAYLAMPIDLVPDVIPVLGYADDAIVSVLVLRLVARRVGTVALRERWPGTPEGFATICTLAGLSAEEE